MTDRGASSELAGQIGLAIDRFLRPFIVPLLQEANGQRYHLGTGTLFRVGSGSYLITAHHVVGDADPNSLLVSAREPSLRPLASLISYAADPCTDVAILRLSQEICDEFIAGRHAFASVGNVRAISGDEQAFVVAGYTCATTQLLGNTLKGDFNMFMTPLYNGPADDLTEPVDHTLELFLRHTNTARTLQDTHEETPHLRGISGASVWAVLSRGTVGAVWSPESQLKLAAIETACKRGSYIRATKWSAVASALQTLDESAAAQVLSALQQLPGVPTT